MVSYGLSGKAPTKDASDLAEMIAKDTDSTIGQPLGRRESLLESAHEMAADPRRVMPLGTTRCNDIVGVVGGIFLQGAGGGIGNQEHVMSTNKDQVRGRVKEAKGKIKEVAGKLLSDKRLQAKGKSQNTLGKAQA